MDKAWEGERGEKGEISIKLSDTPWQDRTRIAKKKPFEKKKWRRQERKKEKHFPTVAEC